ncbi:hypothetical protein ACOKFD_03525 [Flagellimonas sp. S174]|uniref:hypothetical protein n=1 Tax=Flagellimonas sp. S174 TaxID=3410790 RepID=UPI003BF4F483
MSKTKSHKRCKELGVDISSKDSEKLSKTSLSISPKQRELLAFTDALDGPDLVQSLKLVHDMALYDSYCLIDGPEKNALYATKCLWERIEAIAKEP